MFNHNRFQKKLLLFFLAILPLCCFSFILVWVEAEQYWSVHTSFDSLRFQISSDSHSEEISCYYDVSEDIYYLFLPSYMQNPDAILKANYYAINRFLYINQKLQPSGFRLSDYKTDTPYQFTFYDWRGNLLEDKQVVLLQSANLPAMFIQTDSGSMDYIHENKLNREGGRLSLLDTNGNLLCYDSLDYMKGRGNTTWSCSKKPYNISLSHESSLLGMDAGTKWVLLANACDGSYLRNKIAYDTALAMELPFSSQSEFIDLYLNGEYAGLYQLTENVNIGDGRVDLNNLENTTQAVNNRPLAEYEMIDTDYNRAFRIPNNPKDISGGYLLEFAPIKRESIAGFVTKAEQELVLKNPQNATVEQTEYISSIVQNMEDALFSYTASSSESYAILKEKLDISSWTDTYLIAEIFQNVDAYSKSQYFYKPPDEISPRIYSGPVWDYDRSIGNHTFSSYVRPGTLYASQTGRCPWIDICKTQDWFTESVSEHYAQKFLPYLQTLLNNKIDEYAATIEQGAYLDRIRWQGQDNYLLEEPDWIKQVDYLKNYLQEQVSYLTNYWLSDTSFHTVHLEINGSMLQKMDYYIPDGELFCLPSDPVRTDAEFAGWYYKGTDIAFNPENKIYNDIYLTAHWN